MILRTRVIAPLRTLHLPRLGLLTRLTAITPARFSRLISTTPTTPRVSSERLWKDIHHTAQWGRGTRWGEGINDVGMSRLTLTDHDRHARDWFVETTRSLGCAVRVDEMGNIFAVRKGKREGAPTYAGSHLDTQPSGGRYDGVLGVCAGVEMLRALNDAEYESECPVGVVNWTNEEGARFPISMLSSGVWAGGISLERAHALKEIGTSNPRTLKEELSRIGYLGDVKADYRSNPIAAHFELHIEQGPLLEVKGHNIGIVEGIQAYRWHTIDVIGRDCHTGTTDFANRADALLTSTKLILHSHRLASKYKCLASTGVLTLEPGSTNTVPGKVRFSLDIRSGSDQVLAEFEKELKHDFARIASNGKVGDLNEWGILGRECEVQWTLDSDNEATRFDGTCVECVADSAKELLGEKEAGGLTQRMISGAGHDSMFTSRRAPTAMIFVPCREGISHNPAEFCSQGDCANGAQVLTGAVVRYDRLRTS